jgi:hypothetical protein
MGHDLCVTIVYLLNYDNPIGMFEVYYNNISLQDACRLMQVQTVLLYDTWVERRTLESWPFEFTGCSSKMYKSF